MESPSPWRNSSTKKRNRGTPGNGNITPGRVYYELSPPPKSVRTNIHTNPPPPFNLGSQEDEEEEEEEDEEEEDEKEYDRLLQQSRNPQNSLFISTYKLRATLSKTKDSIETLIGTLNSTKNELDTEVDTLLPKAKHMAGKRKTKKEKRNFLPRMQRIHQAQHDSSEIDKILQSLKERLEKILKEEKHKGGTRNTRCRNQRRGTKRRRRV